MQSRQWRYGFAAVFLSLFTLLFLTGCSSPDDGGGASKGAPPAPGANAPKTGTAGDAGKGNPPAKPSTD